MKLVTLLATIAFAFTVQAETAAPVAAAATEVKAAVETKTAEVKAEDHKAMGKSMGKAKHKMNKMKKDAAGAVEAKKEEVKKVEATH